MTMKMKMKMMSALFVGVLALTYAALASADSADKLHSMGVQKMQQLDELKHSFGSLVPVSDSNFGRLALGKGRPYHMFVVFNARKPRHGCGHCGPFEDELEVLASSYDMKDHSDDEYPIYFARAEYDANARSFQNFGLKSVPVLAYFPPTTETGLSKKVFTAKYQGELDAESAASFVEDYTDVKIEVYRSPVPKIMFLVTFFGSIAVTMRYASAQVFALANYIRNSKTIWLILCISVYFISVSGVLYDIIRGVPFVGVDQQTGGPAFISPQSGMQYGAEGLIIGSLNVGCAMFVVGLAKYSARPGKYSDRTLLAISFMLAFFFLYMNIVGLYRRKNSWYRL